MKAFFDRYVRNVPVILPLAALAHLFWTGYTFGNFIADGALMSFIGGGTFLIQLLYTLLWLGVCAEKRWAGIGYIALTAVNLCLLNLTPAGSQWRLIADAFFPFDVLMCFFILFFYKRLR
jgi:hypothetical protein